MIIGKTKLSEGIRSENSARVAELIDTGSVVMVPAEANEFGAPCRRKSFPVIHIATSFLGMHLAEIPRHSHTEIRKCIQSAVEVATNALNSGMDVVMPTEWIQEGLFPSLSDLSLIERHVQATIRGFYLSTADVLEDTTLAQRLSLRMESLQYGFGGITDHIVSGKRPDAATLRQWSSFA